MAIFSQYIRRLPVIKQDGGSQILEMAFYQFTQEQKIPAGIDVVWDFVSSPLNLKDITPPALGFVVTGNHGGSRMYAGMIITYKVRPLLGVPIKWMTEITHVVEGKYFVDEQRIGPYRLWHHQHQLESIGGGVLMRDIVTYAPPLGIIGAFANTLFIRRQLNQIFDYRTVAVEKKFGKWV